MIPRFPQTLFALLFLCFINLPVTSQVEQPKNNDGWIRVRTDDGEFSIEVPAEYAYFADKDGFSFSNGMGGDLPVRNMRMLNAVHEGTFVSFEIYEAGKNALDRIYEDDKSIREAVAANKIREKGYELKTIEYKSDTANWIRKYFRSKKNIYVLTAGSREVASKVASRFFDSLKFEPDTNEQADSGVPLSSLRIFDVVIETRLEKEESKTPAAKSSVPDADVKPLVILSKPRASYVNPARANNVNGVIRLKITLSKDGSIPKIVVVKSLPDGLLRQAVFSALRIKSLPKIKAGLPENSAVTIEYSFSLF